MTFGVGGGGGSSALSGMSDVALNNKANDEVLSYNSTTDKWQNKPVSTVQSDGTVESVRSTSSFTLALSDAGKVLEAESASPLTITVPPTASVAFLDDTMIEVSQTGAGQVTIAPGAGVTLRNSAGLKTRAQWSSLGLRKRPGGAPSLPTTNLVMRYRADDLTGANGSAVASWPESSGAGLPAATQAVGANQPTLVTNSANGHKGVSFDGVNDYLQLTGTALDVARNRTALNVFVIYNYPSAVTGIRTFMSLSTGTSTTSSRITMIHREGTGVLSTGGRRLDADAGAFVNGGAATAPEVGVATSRFVWSSSDLYLYKNGTLSGSNVNFQTAGSTSDTASLAGNIGCNPAAAAEFFAGHILEILVYSVDDAPTRTAVHTYAQNTYGVTVSDYAGPAGDEWVVTGDTAV